MPEDNQIRNYFKKIFNSNKVNEDIREVIEELIEEAEQNGEESFSEHEQLLLNNVLYIKEIKICRVMTPRSEIIAFNKNGSIENLAKLMIEKGHSRIPIYGDSLDDILGFAHVIDVTKGLIKGQDSLSIGEVGFNQIKVISTDALALDTLKDMQQSKTHMAIAMDDYGGLCGLVTIEDLLEEIVGDIEDEYDEEEVIMIKPQENGMFLIDARADIEDVEETIGFKLIIDEDNQRNVDTIGGYVFDLAQRIPNKGEIIDGFDGVEFKIMEVDPNRIKTVMIITPPKAEASDVI